MKLLDLCESAFRDTLDGFQECEQRVLEAEKFGRIAVVDDEFLVTAALREYVNALTRIAGALDGIAACPDYDQAVRLQRLRGLVKEAMPSAECLADLRFNPTPEETKRKIRELLAQAKKDWTRRRRRPRPSAGRG